MEDVDLDEVDFEAEREMEQETQTAPSDEGGGGSGGVQQQLALTAPPFAFLKAVNEGSCRHVAVPRESYMPPFRGTKVPYTPCGTTTTTELDIEPMPNTQHAYGSTSRSPCRGWAAERRRRRGCSRRSSFTRARICVRLTLTATASTRSATRST